jgi:hypothetical protein
MRAQYKCLAVAALLALCCCSKVAAQASVIDVGAAVAIGNKIADLFTADTNGKMIISAVGDGSQCLDGGDWPTLERDNCTLLDSSPFCQSTGDHSTVKTT